MAALLDTGILYASYDRADAWHDRATAILQQEKGRLIVPAPVIPEADHLLGLRLGERAQLLFYHALADGNYFVAELAREGYARVLELNRRFSSLSLGFVDAAIVAIAEQMGVPRIATTDRRDFAPLASMLSLVLLPET
jgi:predicted nucleic acid-binding protein